MNTNNGYLTTGEVAHTLGVALNTVKRWIETGDLHGIKTPGGHWRIPETTLRNFMQEHGIQTYAQQDAVPRRRVLVVDDSVSDCKLVTGILEHSGFPCEIRSVNNGYSGLIQIGAWQPHVLLLDIMMPGINGLELLRRLRSGLDGLSSMDIIVITAAYDQSGVLRTIREMGVESVLTKPIDASQFLPKIRQYLAPGVVIE